MSPIGGHALESDGHNTSGVADASGSQMPHGGKAARGAQIGRTVYYVRCSTRSSGASSKGTPEQAIRYITDAHDAERDPAYSYEELRYIARLDPGWKADLEGGRLPLVGLGALYGVHDQQTLAQEFGRACLPFHDRRAA